MYCAQTTVGQSRFSNICHNENQDHSTRAIQRGPSVWLIRVVCCVCQLGTAKCLVHVCWYAHNMDLLDTEKWSESFDSVLGSPAPHWPSDSLVKTLY